MKNFGGIMKMQLHRKGIKQEVLAKELNIARTTVTAYCSNQRQPDLETLSKICNRLEIDLNWVMGLTDYDTNAMYLHNDFELKVNAACRRVHKEKHKKFLDGVEYLAEIFSEEEDNSKK